MPTIDPRVDAYIERSAPFAQPILRYLREIVHDDCPQVEETIKWSTPHFMHKGMLCAMAAFKEHCAFGFWKGALVVDPDAIAVESAGQFGRIRSVKDLPSRRQLTEYVKRAMALNEEGVRPLASRKRGAPKPPIEMPDDFDGALRRRRGALASFRELRPSHRREYLEWITEAKRPETRARRIAQAVDQIAQGLSLDWKYERR